MHGDSVNCPKCNSVMNEFADMNSHQNIPAGGRGRVHNILVCPSCGHEQLSDKVIFFNNMTLDEMIANDAADGEFGLGPLYNSEGISENNYDDSLSDYNPYIDPYADDLLADYGIDDVDPYYLDDYDSGYYEDYSVSSDFDFFLFIIYFGPMIVFIILLALFVYG